MKERASESLKHLPSSGKRIEAIVERTKAVMEYLQKAKEATSAEA